LNERQSNFRDLKSQGFPIVLTKQNPHWGLHRNSESICDVPWSVEKSFGNPLTEIGKKDVRFDGL
jgi:hypothetical protein